MDDKVFTDAEEYVEYCLQENLEAVGECMVEQLEDGASWGNGIEPPPDHVVKWYARTIDVDELDLRMRDKVDYWYAGENEED